MSRDIYPDYPPKVDEVQAAHIVNAIQDWSIAHGLAVRPPPSFVQPSQDPNTSLAITAPVTLFPSPFPRNCLENALAIQKSYNELYARIASDEAWLRPIVEQYVLTSSLSPERVTQNVKLTSVRLTGVDDFTAALWNVHEKVKAEGYVQDLSLGLFRSDYMVDVESETKGTTTSIKQVEFNTIASSFGGLSTQVSALHDFLLASGVYPPKVASTIKPESLLRSSSSKLLASGLAEAHKAYGSGTTSLPKCVIFLVQKPERNVFDQRHLEYPLLYTHNIRAFRLPFADVLVHTKLDDNRTLIYTPPHSPETPYEVTTLYFRAGYSPDDYTSAGAWDARLHLERSRAIKCPSILTHLSGAKKIQQVLATPSSPHLSRFISDKTVSERLRSTFAPIYPLDSSEAGQEAEKLALDASSAERFVLKPQREGGGNNIYRGKIPGFLKSIPKENWPAYILMEMINPPPLRNAILRNGEVQKGGVIGELGIYGIVLWRSNVEGGDHEGVKEVLVNRDAGYLLRTKGDTSEEGGVAAGFGAVDSVMLVDV
ncbi:glutathione synthetase large chain [Myriangium duriaei CBS 260.36]|uniref:Glutathione synthetase n=1 Tax=Myriangium duriaei CBS 260.36 TaxID=1168546 RepID=A0A9P4MQA8_9PEZI|nr:glutathione synthetase large chain [Myriangium duriaei CBS 260.36]